MSTSVHPLRTRTSHVGLLLCLVLFAAACRHKPPPAPPAPPRVASSVIHPTVAPAMTLRGRVAAGSRLRLGFKMPGVVAKVLVKEGDRVAKGQVVALLDTADALAQVRAAQPARDKARRDFARAKKLADEAVVPPSGLEDAKDRLDVAAAALGAATDALRRTQLTSPVRGTVFRRLAEAGETVPAGVPVVMVDESDRPVVRAGVTERVRSQLQQHDRVSIVLDGIRAVVDGEISSLASTPEPGDGLFTVEVAPAIDATHPGTQIPRPGALVTVVPLSAREPTIRLSLDALVRRRGKDWVFVIEPGMQPRVRIREVTLGASEGAEVVVGAGLSEGESIVTEGAYFLQDGDAVALLPSPPASSPEQK